MNIILKGFLITFSALFFLLIVSMVRKKHLELKYTLTWLIAGFTFVIIAIFDSIVRDIAKILNVIEPVNALFLIVIFFILVILFTLTITVSKASERVRTLAQELALLKQKYEKKEKFSNED